MTNTNNKQIIKNVSEVSLNQTIGRTWTNNNTTYKTVGKVIKINGNTIHIKSELKVRGYEEGRVFTYSFSKSTKFNHVFIVENVDEVIEFNHKMEKLDNNIKEKVNEYWTDRFTKADQEAREKGVVKESETFLITGKGLEHQYNTYKISE